LLARLPGVCAILVKGLVLWVQGARWF
jgi:hypothetical protein